MSDFRHPYCVLPKPSLSGFALRWRKPYMVGSTSHTFAPLAIAPGPVSLLWKQDPNRVITDVADIEFHECSEGIAFRAVLPQDSFGRWLFDRALDNDIAIDAMTITWLKEPFEGVDDQLGAYRLLGSLQSLSIGPTSEKSLGPVIPASKCARGLEEDVRLGLLGRELRIARLDLRRVSSSAQDKVH